MELFPGWLAPLLAGCFGLLIGSFLNVAIYRLPRDLSVVRPRSRCPACDLQIRAYDNIPMFSYVLLRGRCRDCGGRISWRYPAVELLTSLLFAGFVVLDGVTPLALRNCTLSALFLALVFTDLETRLLPEPLTIGGIVAGLGFSWFVEIGDGTAALLGFHGRLGSLLDSVLGVVIPAGLLWLTGVVFRWVRGKEGLGFGDVVMIAEAGAFLGLRAAFLTLVTASIAGSVVGLILLVRQRESAWSYELPLGSFLGLAGIAVAVFGKRFTSWYASFF